MLPRLRSRRAVAIGTAASAAVVAVLVPVAAGGTDAPPPPPDSADVAYAQLGLMELADYERQIRADLAAAPEVCARAEGRLADLRRSVLAFPDHDARQQLATALDRFEAALAACDTPRHPALQAELDRMHDASDDARSAISEASDQ
jgi:hypothetical protein